MSARVTFIGGPMDGEVREFDEPRPYFQCHKHLPVRRLAEMCADPRESFETVQYQLLPLRGEKSQVYLYLIQGMTADQALWALVNSYHPKVEAKT